MDREELIDFLRENLTIEIERDQDYYSYPHLMVKIKIGNETISNSSCTIYDGECDGCR